MVVNIEIHGIEWDVIMLEDEDDVIMNKDGPGVGLCDYCKYTIYVAKDLKRSQLRTVLIHELTHAFRWTYGLVSERDKITIPTTEIEEIIANSIEVFGTEIIECADEVLECFMPQKKENKKHGKKV